MSIQSEIDRINDAVANQSTLIGQIKTALQGKVSGGGGGTAIETCTLTVKNYFTTMSNDDDYYRAIVYVDGSLNTKSEILPMQEGLPWLIEPTIHTYTIAKGTFVFIPFGARDLEDDSIKIHQDDGDFCDAFVIIGDTTLLVGD